MWCVYVPACVCIRLKFLSLMVQYVATVKAAITLFLSFMVELTGSLPTSRLYKNGYLSIVVFLKFGRGNDK